MSRAQVRKTCGGDDGSLCFRIKAPTDELEVRNLTGKNVSHGYYLFFRNGGLASIHPNYWRSESNAMEQWYDRVGPFPPEHRDAEAAAEIFGRDGIPFHGDFSKVDTKAKLQMQREDDEVTSMLIWMTWWNPLAWVVVPVGFPIYVIVMAVYQDAGEQAERRIDAIPIGASMQQVIASAGKPDESISRDGLTYLVFNPMNYTDQITRVAMQNGKVRGVYPSLPLNGHPHAAATNPTSPP